MASTATIGKVVKTLCEAHGRKPSEETFEAYRMALETYNDNELERALVSTLREQREFMAPPGIVAGLAQDARNADIRSRTSSPLEERRVKCLTCEDRGSVFIMARQWLMEHRDAFAPEWFVEGWMRDAEAWCRQNGVRGLVQMAVCSCDCYPAGVFRRQRERYMQAVNGGHYDERKDPKPAFGLALEDRDCIVATKASYDIQAAIMQWTEEDRVGRTWAGNWNP